MMRPQPHLQGDQPLQMVGLSVMIDDGALRVLDAAGYALKKRGCNAVQLSPNRYPGFSVGYGFGIRVNVWALLEELDAFAAGIRAWDFEFRGWSEEAPKKLSLVPDDGGRVKALVEKLRAIWCRYAPDALDVLHGPQMHVICDDASDRLAPEDFEGQAAIAKELVELPLSAKVIGIRVAWIQVPGEELHEHEVPYMRPPGQLRAHSEARNLWFVAS